MLKIETVDPAGYAAELGLEPGDMILAINDHPIEDILDYHLEIGADQLNIEVLHDDEVWELVVDKDADEDFGIEVEHPEPRQCGNQCLFCFVHQLPKGMRKTLYVKDEDYRFSYLYGSYITLTNLHQRDIERIVTRRLSPLYISVHATDHALRERLLGVDIPNIMPLIKRLTESGIVLHCQVVLCPGINDGQALKQTITDLAALYPGVASLAVVPVGLTRYREKLPALNGVSREHAQKCLELIESCQRDCLPELGTRFVFAADELYLKAEREIPAIESYEDCFQLENGVGMIAQFRQQAEEVLLEAEPLPVPRVNLVCGRSFASELQHFASRMMLRTGVDLQVVTVENDFFGAEVTVSGLVTGRDLLKTLAVLPPAGGVMIPDVMLRVGEDVFLDDVAVTDIETRLKVPVVVVESSPWGILEGLERLADGPEIIHCEEF